MTDINQAEGELMVEHKIHIYNEQRKGRKMNTKVCGIPSDIDLDLLKKVWTKEFHCIVIIKEDKATKLDYISLNGEFKEEVKKFLIEEGIGTEENIEIH